LAGNVLVSVTTVLNVIDKPALVPWAKNQQVKRASELFAAAAVNGSIPFDAVEGILAESKRKPAEVVEAAGAFGTTAHDLIGKLIGFNEAGLEIPEEFEPTVAAYREWERTSGLAITATEKYVYSRDHRYAGTLDIQAFDVLTERPVIVDIKTGNGIWPEMDLQVAAYCEAVTEMDARDGIDYGEPLKGWIIRLSKTAPKPGESGFEARMVPDTQAAFQAFLHARYLWQWQQDYRK